MATPRGANDPRERSDTGPEDAGSDPDVGLRAALGEAGNFVRMVADSLASASSRAAAMEERLIRLEGRLEEVESDSHNVAERLVSAEDHVSRLMGLYVAAYQLHSTLDPGEVQATIADISINLLGAERFALLLVSHTHDAYDVALAEGLEGPETELFANGRYLGGDAMVDATLSDATLRIGPMAGSHALAVVPLTVQDSSVGALVIFKLLDHKHALAAQDRELLDLLAAHAASALFTAQMHASSERKLRTLESLVSLARKA